MIIKLIVIGVWQCRKTVFGCVMYAVVFLFVLISGFAAIQ